MKSDSSLKGSPASSVAPSGSSSAASSKEWLSALADGEAQALAPACAAWRDDPEARRTWHAYHLIGDVMRSDELAGSPARDAAFRARLRERLAQEPVVVAPAERVQPVAKPAAWHVPVAVAAGFVVVAGVLLVARMGPALAPAGGVELAAASAAAGARVEQVAERQSLIVDPRLQEFLRVHQAAGGGMATAAPGGALRRVDLVVPVPASR